MKNKNSNVNVDFSQLKNKILDVINYSNELLENNSFDNYSQYVKFIYCRSSHVFDKENRSFYNLEHIWHDGKEVSREEIQSLITLLSS